MNSYPVRKERPKEILEWRLNGILLIPPAYICLFQKLQNRTRQPFVFEEIHHLEPGLTLTPPLPARANSVLADSWKVTRMVSDRL
jgi:hypothetical protein